MKIVVFGPGKRTGVLRDDEVIDVAGVVAKRLREQEEKNNPMGLAETLASSDLGGFIEGGQSTLKHTEQALEYLYGEAGDRAGVHGEQIVFPAADIQLHAPRARGARVACAGGNFADHSQAMAERRAERGEASEVITDPRERVRKRGFWGPGRLTANPSATTAR